jgi:hypothetical protein
MNAALIGAGLRGVTSVASEEINIMDTMVNEEIVRVTDRAPSPASGSAAWAVMLTGLVLYNPLTPTGHDKGGIAIESCKFGRDYRPLV